MELCTAFAVVQSFGSGPHAVRKIVRGNAWKARSPATPRAGDAPSGASPVKHAGLARPREGSRRRVIAGAARDAGVQERGDAQQPEAKARGNCSGPRGNGWCRPSAQRQPANGDG